MSGPARPGGGPGTVVVFAPCPRLSIHFEVPPPGRDDPLGRPHLHFHPGGQGVWVGRMALALGAPVELCGAFGGEAGIVVRALLEADGFTLQAVDAGAESGTSAHRGNEGEPASVVFSSPDPTLGRHQVDELYSRVLDAALAAGTCVISGTPDPATVPADTFRRLAADLTGNGVVVVADLSGDQLRQAVAGGLSFVKASHEDLGLDLGDDAWHRAVQAAARQLGQGGADVLVSCGDAGAVAVVGGVGHRLSPPHLEAVNTRGAGDAMTGALAAGLASGLDRVAAVRLAAAAGTLSVTRRGLATGDDRTVARLTRLVSIEELGPVDQPWA